MFPTIAKLFGNLVKPLINVLVFQFGVRNELWTINQIHGETAIMGTAFEEKKCLDLFLDKSLIFVSVLYKGLVYKMSKLRLANYNSGCHKFTITQVYI